MLRLWGRIGNLHSFKVKEGYQLPIHAEKKEAFIFLFHNKITHSPFRLNQACSLDRGTVLSTWLLSNYLIGGFFLFLPTPYFKGWWC